MNDVDKSYIIREAKVLSTDDVYGGNRIKVRLYAIDSTKSDSELPYCFPLMPKLIHVLPKVGEAVLVILQKIDSGFSNRYYIGPILSQPYYYYKDLADYSAYSLINDKKVSPLQVPISDPENVGTLPDDEDVAIIGRSNTDLILKDDEVRLRCGYKDSPNGPTNIRLHLNKRDPAYIQMKYKKLTLSDKSEVNSVINIVADRINLISHDSKNKFETTDPQSLITDEEQKKIIEKGHPLIYGDELVSLLKQLIEVFRTHKHAFHNKTPTITVPKSNILNTDLEQMLSKTIKIN